MIRLKPVLFIAFAGILAAAPANANTIFGLDAEPSGAATIDTTDARRLEVHNLGSSGQDGVQVGFRRSSTANLTAAGFSSTGELNTADFTAGVGHSVSTLADLDGDGSLDLVASQHYSLSSSGDRPQESVSADFSKIGSTHYEAIVEVNSIAVESVFNLDPTNADPSKFLANIEFGNLPDGSPLVERRIRSGNLGSSGQDGVSFDWQGVSQVSLPGLPPLDVQPGSEVTLELLAQGGHASVPSGSIEFLAANLASGMAFTDVTPAPEPSTIALAMIGGCIGLASWKLQRNTRRVV